MSEHESTPKLHVDTDWKAEAQAEKERLEQKVREKEKDRPQTPGELPPADFKSLVGVLASQALMSLGGYEDPASGRRVVDLQGAKFGIDLLGVLEEKCTGNISDEEATELTQVLAELRSRFVQFSELVAKQQAAGGAAAAPGASPGGLVEP